MKRAGILACAALLLIAAAEPLPPDQEIEHVVQPGETLMGIAHRAKVPRVLIAEANGLKPPYVVRAGQKLKIPRTRRHKVEKGDTSLGISNQYAVPWKDIAVANGLAPDASPHAGKTLLIPTVIAPPADDSATAPRFTWPLAGEVRRGFARRGQRDYHDGLDIKVESGTTVRAAAAGKVIFAGEDKKQFGKLVIMDHGDGWQSAYGFLSRITVGEGDAVKQGERIGLSGRTGRAKGPELHFELRRNAVPVDPMPRLPEAP
jgi:murein DD-endopeptidase MepM/ murein hydrolase activator NlpD